MFRVVGGVAESLVLKVERVSTYCIVHVYDLWYQKGMKDRTNQGFINISSSRGSKIMFALLIELGSLH